MACRTDILWSDELLGYDFGAGHPMASARLDLTMGLSRALGLLDLPGVRVVGVEPAADDELRRVHGADYLAAVRAAGERPAVVARDHGLGTQDTPVFAGMHEASARIVDGSVRGALAVWRGEAEHAVNVAGGMHHAMPDAASGFCVYNDAAVAIARLLDEGVERVAYVDLDAHHGDGVERVFWDDPRVLTVSVHESGATLFPGTGAVTATGGAGAPGSVVNVPLPAGTDGRGWARAVDAVVPQVLRAFSPQVVVSQHGCDGHRADPLSNLRLSVRTLRWAAERVHALAHELAEGRWLALGGGGYAVTEVVPFVWAHLVSVAAHEPTAPGGAVPAAWAQDVGERWATRIRRSLSDAPTDRDPVTEAADGALPDWEAGYDPASPVDQAVRAARQAAFPALGLYPGPG